MRLLVGEALAAKGAQRPPQHRRRLPRSPSVIRSARPSRAGDRPRRRLRRRGARERRLRDLEQAAAAGQTAGEQSPRCERVQVGLAREPRVERLEPLGGLEQQRRARRCRGCSANAIWRAQQLDPGALQLVERARLRRWPAAPARRRARRPGAWPALRPTRAAHAARLGRQHRRALEERGGRGKPAARLRPPGRALQLRGDLLVGPDRRVGADATPGGQDRARGSVASASARCTSCRSLRRRPPGRPPSAPADDGNAPAHRARSAPPPRPAPPRRPRSRAARPRATASVGSPTGSAAATSSSRWVSAGSGSKLPEEALLDPARQRRRVRQPESARQLRWRQPARQLQQRQRVAARLGDDPVAHALVQPARRSPSPAARAHRRRQTPDHAAPAAPPTRARRSARARRTPTRPAPPAGGAPRTRASARRLDQATARHRRGRPAAASSATSASRLSTASPTRKRSGGAPGAQAERRRQRIALRARQPLEPVQHRRAQLLQTRRTGAPSRTQRPPLARARQPDARSDRYSNSAVFPNPASPRKTST